MLGEARADDFPEVVRATLRQIESAEWWRAKGIDGVVLYACHHARACGDADGSVFLRHAIRNGGIEGFNAEGVIAYGRGVGDTA